VVWAAEGGSTGLGDLSRLTFYQCCCCCVHLEAFNLSSRLLADTVMRPVQIRGN